MSLEFRLELGDEIDRMEGGGKGLMSPERAC